MNIDKNTILDLLHQTGQHDQADQAAGQLPDQVDTDQHAGLLSRLGINLPELLGKLGGGTGGGLGGLLGGLGGGGLGGGGLGGLLGGQQTRLATQVTGEGLTGADATGPDQTVDEDGEPAGPSPSGASGLGGLLGNL